MKKAPRGSQEERSFRFDPVRRDLLKAITAGVLVGARASDAFAVSEPRRTEIAVVGAGLFGSSTAMHLASGGARSVSLIGPPEIAGGTSPAQTLASHYDESRNSTVMDADLEWAELAQASIGPMRALESRSGMKILDEVGSLHVTQGRLAAGYFNLPGIRENAAKLGVRLVDLGSDTLDARYPDVRFDADSLGLLQERDAGVLHPRRLVTALRKLAVEDGVTWMDDEVARIEPHADYVDLVLGSGSRVRAQRLLVATGAAPIGHALLTERQGGKPTLLTNLPTLIEVPDAFETKLPPTLLTSSGGAEFFGGFVAPPMRYPDGRRYLKVVGQARSLVDGALVSDQPAGAIGAAMRLFPTLNPGAVHSRVCMTTDTESGRPIIDWVDPRIAVAIAGNGKGAKAALEIGRRAAALVATPARA